MNDKFTLRDFFVYFLSGIVVLLFLFVNNYKEISFWIVTNKEELKDFSSVIIFFSIPIAYFLGQIIHGIDTIVYFIAVLTRKFKEPKKGRVFFYIWIIPFYLINAYRISGRLYIKKIDSPGFWEDCAKLQVEKQFSASEYWYVMNDLFKGLCLVSFLFFIISLLFYDWVYFLGYFLLTIFFWLRAVYFAGNFIDTIIRTKKNLLN